MTDFLQHLVDGVSLGAIYALIALGYTMVYGVLQLINFAHGDVFMLGAMIGWYASAVWTSEARSPSILGAIAVTLFAMVLCGAVGFTIERLAYRPLRGSPRINSLITAIGVSFFLEYGGQLVFGPDPKFFPTLTPKHIIHFGGIVTTNYQIIVLIVAVIFMGLLQSIFYGTNF